MSRWELREAALSRKMLIETRSHNRKTKDEVQIALQSRGSALEARQTPSVFDFDFPRIEFEFQEGWLEDMSSTAVGSENVDRQVVNRTATGNDVAHETSSGDTASADGSVEKKASGGPTDKRKALKRRREEESKFNLMNLLPLLFVGFAFLALKVPASRQKQKFNWNDTQYVYAFGDSYTFVQGTAGYPNFSFIGDALKLSFTPTALLSNQIVPKNIEFLTGCFEGRPSDCSPHQLWDFAFADADIDPKILPLHHDFSVDLVDQVKQWATYAADVIPHPPEKTLTAWWIGISDTGDSFDNTTIADWTTFWHSELRSYFNAVEFAYGRGLRGTYLFINVPPGQRKPARKDDPNGQELLRKRVVEFNTILSGYIQGIAARHRNLNVLSFDAYTWFNEVLDNPGQYGFTNTTGFCQCSDPTFFWYDEGHITQRAHELLADAIQAQLLAASS
ncbi:hypothetical protein NM688_g1269 [Phlebia brevispora]|uniref:Uncharacterized protein n=1 Tax=Phlebia brevispora TaxID=194682 RepID=A0ACC1TC06_9APHY|nr:hypothetical protein NM688_g1269 [Phlebia brevispora]